MNWPRTRTARLFSRNQTAGAGASWVPGGPTTPSKYAVLESGHFDEDPHGASKGQVLVLFALFLIGMIGMLGLATDVGFWAVARRTAQGAADAGSFAGARQIAEYSSTNQISAIADVSAVVAAHNLGPYNVSIYRCEYIDRMWNVVGTCDQKVPVAAIGARIRTQLTVPTFFMRALALFGAPSSVTVFGYAKARVEVAKNSPSDAPFIICGTNAWRVADKSGGATNDVQPIFGGSTSLLNQAMVGSTFRIFDVNAASATKPNNLFLKTGADCGSKADATTKQGMFVGLADGAANGGKAPGAKFSYVTAASTVRPGTVGTKIDGAAGCVSGTISSGCVMIIPIASRDDPPVANEITVRAYGAFIVTKVSDTQYNAKLLYDYIISGPGTLYADKSTAWARDNVNPVVIRLIW